MGLLERFKDGVQVADFTDLLADLTAGKLDFNALFSDSFMKKNTNFSGLSGLLEKLNVNDVAGLTEKIKNEPQKVDQVVDANSTFANVKEMIESAVKNINK